MSRLVQKLAYIIVLALLASKPEFGCAQRPKNRNHRRIQNLKSETAVLDEGLPPLSPHGFEDQDRRILKGGKKGGPKGLFGPKGWKTGGPKGFFGPSILGPKKGIFGKQGYGNGYGAGYNGYGSYNAYNRPGPNLAGILTPVLIIAAVILCCACKMCGL